MFSGVTNDMAARHIESPFKGTYYGISVNITDQKIIHLLSAGFSFLVFGFAGLFTGLLFGAITFYATTAAAKYFTYQDKLNQKAIESLRKRTPPPAPVSNPELKRNVEGPALAKKEEGSCCDTKPNIVIPGPNNTRVNVVLTQSQTLSAPAPAAS